MLHTKYIIFGYNMAENGIVTIKELWLKNVWEICRSMEDWALNVQCKKGVIYKIRPATWYSSKGKFPVFKSLEHFLSAIEETLYQYLDTHAVAVGWRKKMIQSYKERYDVKLEIPRWEEIEQIYRVE